MQGIDKRPLIGGMFMSSTLEASVFMGKNYSVNLNLHSIKTKRERFQLKTDVWHVLKVDSRTIR